MVSKQEAALELLKRKAGRTSLLGFIRYTKPDYQVNWHHKVTAKYLDAWLTGQIKRLIICEPPRHGKSEQVSRRLPAYIFGKHPNAKVIAASYSADLAAMLNRDVQRIIDTPEYHNLFPYTRLNVKNVRSDAEGSYLKNSEIFEIVGYQGVYRSVGRGGGVTGMGGDFIIIDDPIKNKEEALSETIRNSTWEWYTTVIRTRAETKESRILITVTRWHLDDLVGRLLEQQKADPNADRWVVLVLPSRYDRGLIARIYGSKIANLTDTYDHRAEGELLWPSKFDRASDLATEAALGSDDYSALYLQSPIPPGGRMFYREWFNLVEAVPMQALRIRYWDKAGTQGSGAYTAGVLIAFDGKGYYIEDVVRKQVGATEREALIKATTQLDWQKYGNIHLGEGVLPYAVWLEQEPGSGGKESAENTQLNLAGYPVYIERVTGDKVIRATPFSVQAKAGNISILIADWTEAYIRELETFPRGRFKDQVDGTSGGFNKLTLGWEGEQQTVIYDEGVSISPY